MSDLLPMLVGGPLLAAGLSLTLGSLPARRLVLWLTTAAVLGYAAWLLAATADGSVVVEQVGGWPAGISIPFAADTFSALMVAVTALLVAVCTAYAAAAGEDGERYFVPLVLVLSAGVYGAYVTADLFNLFVMIEVALIPSYVLLTRTGKRRELGASRIYLTVNLLISTALLLGVGLLYGVAGTVNLGELAGVARESDAAAVAAGVVLVALGGKAALVPLHGWLPRTYPFAATSVSALFSGLLTKIGVYGLFRVYAVVFDGAPEFQALLQVVLIATMVIGVLGALGEPAMRAILSFHMTSQVGYILLGLGFFGVPGLAAGIFYLVHHIIVKASLFLSCGAVERSHGTGELHRLGGVARRAPVLALAFMIAALSLTGIPPFSGFIAKFTLVSAAFEAEQYIAAGFAVLVSLFTLLSMLKIWGGVFWGKDPAEESAVTAAETGTAGGDGQADTGATGTEPGGAGPAGATGTSAAGGTAPVGNGSTGVTATATTADATTAATAAATAVADEPLARPRPGPALVAPALLLATITLALGIGAEGLLSLAETAAEGLVDTSGYVEAVTAP